ncbi:hypothetical protein D9M68_622670 [compost metagenome]
MYTFWGFDLFFHEQTRLKDSSIDDIKTGLQKIRLVKLVEDFCAEMGIGRFSVIGYSMGSHYATVLAEALAHRIDEYIVAAPSSVKPGKLIRFFSRNKFGNAILERLCFSKTALINSINLFKGLAIIDATGQQILRKEVKTAELRFNLYACLTYLQHLETDEELLIRMLNDHQVKSYFIFGIRDKMYLPRIANKFFRKFNPTAVLYLDEDHNLINANFAKQLAEKIL